ncbi:hypothetical protein [Oceaniglobus trochenteri]|uniref:hypothetical protein n=1 Tax=Oceaniglobus trochenteri TaxID=2763260 RepID=UPI001CFFF662|nr:hypothetical protein [Oceaniglobus trochenteri]
MTFPTTARLAMITLVLAGLAGCAVVKVPVKAAGTVVGHTILAVTQSAHRPATLPLDGR